MAAGLMTLAADTPTLDSGSTAFMLLSAALVLIMTPGLAFFYGGMVRVKSVLNMLMMSFIAIGIVTILWTLYGFSLAFHTNSAFIGDFSWFGIAEHRDHRAVARIQHPDLRVRGLPADVRDHHPPR